MGKTSRELRQERREARNDAKITRHVRALLKSQAKADGTYQRPGRRGGQR